MKIRGFTKSYQGRIVLEYPDMVLEPGKVYAFLGANGSGKTTLARIMAGVLLPDESGADIWEGPVDIGYMPQKSYAFNMSIRQNLLLNGGAGVEGKARAQKLLDQVGLTCIQNRRGIVLSGGETARVALARLLMRDYQVLVLDEPTAAMDIQATLKSEALLRAYQRETGCAVVLITHLLKQARRMADEVVFLSEGCVVEAGPVKRVLQEPKQEETKRFLEFYNL